MVEHWRKHLLEHWGIDARLTVLNGEYDLNIKAIDTNGVCYLVKVMRSGCDIDFVQMQCNALTHIKSSAVVVNVHSVLSSNNQRTVESLPDQNDQLRLVWVLPFIEGVEYAHFKPKSTKLITDLGTSIAHLHQALNGFEHVYLTRDFKWNLLQANWISEHLSIIANASRQNLIKSVMLQYNKHLDAIRALPSVAIHNDINDYNIIVSAALGSHATINGLIDFGDMCKAPRVCDLAIAGAYIMMDHPEPQDALIALVAAFNQQLPLSEQEVDLVYPLIRVRLAVSVVNSTIEALNKPDDPYVVISQAPAWALLENKTIEPALLQARLRVACGLPVTESAARVLGYLDNQARGHCAPLLGHSIESAECYSLSVERCSVPQNPFELQAAEARTVSDAVGTDAQIWLGYYNEPRLIYTDKAFRKSSAPHSDRRTVHLGVDVFAPAGTELQMPLDGEVCVVENRTGHLDYGGMVVFKHTTPEADNFYSLHGHLDPAVCQKLKQGQQLKAGQVYARLGAAEHNGGWEPHLHLQLAMSIAGLGLDWPGVADPDDVIFWNALCPNPATLLNLADEKVCYQPVCDSALVRQRAEDFATNLKLSYSTPVTIIRAWRHFLFDQWGRPYLDAYNNVPHVGHVHPRLQRVVSEQLKRLNTNTRYMHPAQSALARKLKSKLPEPLSVCYFVNSGSEANELALRLSRAHTQGKDIVTPDHGYHGNTTGAVDISAYKFNAPGGVGKPDWVQLVDIPDVYAGTYRQPHDDCAQLYANQIDAALERITAANGKLAGFIAETFPSVGGQIIPPTGYLKEVYKKIRAAGGVCIADEVQTGLGRLGKYYFAFEQQEVIPDIVVLGKPLGNGHPLAAVITTKAISDSFAQGPEFFSTFGGSTLSCMVAKEVLDIVDDEGLADNARSVGAVALAKLNELKRKHPAIGDVRGIGLFIGVSFVSDRVSRAPEPDLAAFVVNRLRENRILAGLEGPDNNVLKIRPPLTIDEQAIQQIADSLDQILSETCVQSS